MTASARRSGWEEPGHQDSPVAYQCTDAKQVINTKELILELADLF
jgi:hypothetical protein